jgi:hypothetical protein
VGQIVDELVQGAGEAARPAVEEDVGAFLDDLARKGLLEP